MKTTTTFEDPVPDSRRYQGAVARAKARTAPTVAALANTPRFDELPRQERQLPNAAPPPAKLSSTTTGGLEALARAQPPRAAPEEVVPAEGLPPEKPVEEEPGTPEDDAVKLRKSVEARVQPIDIGRYLVNGEATQHVPIIPGKLEVTFRTVTEYEEGWVDTWLGKHPDVTGRMFMRLSNEAALAFYIAKLADQAWPPTTNKDGTVIEANVLERIAKVRRLPAGAMYLLVQNMGWFLERVNKGLTAEAMGNG